MKAVLVSALVAAGVFSAGVAQASPELAKGAGCMKCHDIDKKKKGPAFKESSAKYKGKPDAEAAMVQSLTGAKTDHPEISAKPEEVKAVVKWILTQ